MALALLLFGKVGRATCPVSSEAAKLQPPGVTQNDPEHSTNGYRCQRLLIFLKLFSFRSIALYGIWTSDRVQVGTKDPELAAAWIQAVREAIERHVREAHFEPLTDLVSVLRTDPLADLVSVLRTDPLTDLVRTHFEPLTDLVDMH